MDPCVYFCVCISVCPADVSMCAGSGRVDQGPSEHRPDPDSPHQVSRAHSQSSGIRNQVMMLNSLETENMMAPQTPSEHVPEM